MAPSQRKEWTMLIDCGTCTVRGEACGDCVVSVLLGEPGGSATVRGVHEVDEVECRALSALAAAGMVPQLRHTGEVGHCACG